MLGMASFAEWRLQHTRASSCCTQRGCKRQRSVRGCCSPLPGQPTQLSSPPPSLPPTRPLPGLLVTEKPVWDAALAAGTRADNDLTLAINNAETLGDLYNLLTRNVGALVPEQYCSCVRALVALLQPVEGKMGAFQPARPRPADANRVLAAIMPELQKQLPHFETEQLSFLLALLPDLPAGVDKDLVAAICRVACKCFCEAGRLADCSTASLAAVAWALAMLQYRNEWAWQQLAQAVSQKLPTFTTTELSHTACAFAIAQRYQPQLFDAFAQQAKSWLRLPQSRRVLGPVFAAGREDNGGSNMEWAAAETEETGSPQDAAAGQHDVVFSSSDLAMLMWSFASVKHYDVALLTAMSGQIYIRLERSPGMQGRDLLAETLTAKFWQQYPACSSLTDTHTPDHELLTTFSGTLKTQNDSSSNGTFSEIGESARTGIKPDVASSLRAKIALGAAASTEASNDTGSTVAKPNAKLSPDLEREIENANNCANQASSAKAATATAAAVIPEAQVSGRDSCAHDLPGCARFDMRFDADVTRRVASGDDACTSDSRDRVKLGNDPFRPVEVAQLAWSYAGLKHHDRALFGLLGQAMLHRAEEYSEKDLYDILMAYTSVNHHDPVLIKTLCTCLTPKLSLLPPANLSTLLFSLARVHKHRPWEVYVGSFLEGAAQLLVSRVHDMKFGEMAKVVWAFAALRHYDSAIMEAVASQVPVKCNMSQPGGLAMMVQAYATLNCYNAAVFGAVAQIAQRKLSGFNCSQLGALAGAYALVDWQDMAIFQGIYKRLNYMDAAMFEGDPDALRQLSQVELFLRQLHADTTGRPILPPQFLQKPQRRPQGKTKSSKRISRLTADLYRALLRKGSRPVVGAPSEDKLMSVDLSFRWKNKFDIALQAGAKSCYTLSKPHLPLGVMRARHRLLEARGWKVVSVPFFKWESADGNPELQDKVLDECLASIL